MGHTRMTTQGSESQNYNNHPFYGKVASGSFALAHNGVLRNDHKLQVQKKLPVSRIETDSYVIVQLLEQAGSVDMQTLGKVSEQLIGSFTYTQAEGVYRCSDANLPDRRSRLHLFLWPQRQRPVWRQADFSAWQKGCAHNHKIQIGSTSDFRLAFHGFIEIKPALFQILDQLRFCDAGCKIQP